MTRVIADNVTFLSEAKEALENLEALKNQYNELEIDEKKLEKTLNAEKKAIADSIALTVKKRKEEITSTYDKEIRNDQEELKKIKAKREKAKLKGMMARIEEETADLSEQNRQLKSRIKTLLKQNKMPAFCNSTFYYALFFTKTPKDFIILFATLLFSFLGLPCGIFFLIPERKTVYLIIIYFVTIVVIAALYIVIANKTKVDNLSVLREIRKMRLMMEANHKKIRAISHSIENDKNDSIYALDHFDEEIQEIEQELQEIAERKEAALYTFENETRLLLSNEIKQNNQDRLLHLADEKQQVSDALKELASQIKSQTITITDDYEAYLGKEFMTFERLDMLISIFQQGQASNLTEAQEICRSGKNDSL